MATSPYFCQVETREWFDYAEPVPDGPTVKSMSALAAEYDMSYASVQKHVAVLERAGLISKRRDGREQLTQGEVQAVRSVASMLTELEDVWRGRIARIDELIASDPEPTKE